MKDNNSLATQSAQWLDVITATQDYEDASRAYEFKDGGIIILPLVRKRSFFNNLSSLPDGWGFGGILSRTRPTPDVLRHVIQDLCAIPRTRIQIKPNPLEASLWVAAVGGIFPNKPLRAHVLDLSAGFSGVWRERFSGKTRNQIRKAEKSGIDVQCDTTGRFSQPLHQLYELSVKRWVGRTGIMSWWRASRLLSSNTVEKFHNIGQVMGARCQTWMAWREGQPIAGIMVLRSARHAQYIFGAMNKKLAGPVNANDLLHRLAIEDACCAGISTYQMGTSGDNDSLAHFKERFGACEVAFPTFRHIGSPVERILVDASRVGKRVLNKAGKVRLTNGI